MKIEQSHQQQIRQASNSGRKTVKISQNSGSVGGNLGFSDKSQVIASHLEKLIRSLKSPGLRNLKFLNKALPPLNDLLKILAKSSLSAHDSDLLLIDKFVNSWLKKYGDFLPSRHKKDLSELSNFLKSIHLEVKDDESSRILYSFSSGQEKKLPSWKVDFFDREKTGSPGEEDYPLCVFDLQLEHLGEIRTTVTEQENRRNCFFLCTRRDTAKMIRDSLQVFNNQLKERGVKLPQIKVLRKSLVDRDQKRNFKRGLNLWG